MDNVESNKALGDANLPSQSGDTPIIYSNDEPLTEKAVGGNEEVQFDGSTANESTWLRDAEIEARNAVLEATKKLNVLKPISLFDITTELQLLWAASGFLPPTPASKSDPMIPLGQRPMEHEYDSTLKIEKQRPCLIRRLSMDDWSTEKTKACYDEPVFPNTVTHYTSFRPVPNSSSYLEPVIQAYYETPPLLSTVVVPRSTSKDFMVAHDDTCTTEKPMRVRINSVLVLQELSRASKLALEMRQFNMLPPYKILVHNWTRIRTTFDELKDKLAGSTDKGRLEELKLRIAHMQCLIDFMTQDLGYLLGLQQKIHEGTLKAITFEELYFLYSPGDLAFNREEDNSMHIYQVYAVTGGRRRLSRHESCGPPYASQMDRYMYDVNESGIGTWTDVVVDCFSLRWDGTRVGPARRTLRFEHYTGYKEVTGLGFYPLRFLDKSEEICETLVDRGRRVLDCFGHKKYTDLQEMESDVYFDAKAYKPQDPLQFEMMQIKKTKPSSCETVEQLVEISSSSTTLHFFHDHEVDAAQFDEFVASHSGLTSPRTPQEFEAAWRDYPMLLYHIVPGYNFRQRKWVQIDINMVDEIDKSDEARTRGWQDLVIKEGYGHLLLSLVNNYSSAIDYKAGKDVSGHGMHKTAQIDLIKGKGQGLIVLLYGPPGTGKTSTAETIAAYTGKPLYSITCGDLGTNPSDVEDNLELHTTRAEKWGCVLLLDEADVYLAKRTWEDVGRNALVSVFLRHLEYYKGVLFLTTNIVGMIDEAFKSRIHLALRYDPIDLNSTTKIWDNMLNRLIKDNAYADVKVKFNRHELMKFARTHYKEHERDDSTWNARQIRNAFSTAIGMGQFDRLERIRKEGLTPEEVASSPKKGLRTIRLTSENLSKIAETAADFEEYLSSVRGRDQENAIDSRQRNDYFSGKSEQPRRKTYGHWQEDEKLAGRRRGHTTTQSTRPSKGQRVQRHTVQTDKDDDEGYIEEGQGSGVIHEEVADFSDDEDDSDY